jgi:peptidyl-prolyl cis-trans isomerase SurA
MRLKYYGSKENFEREAGQKYEDIKQIYTQMMEDYFLAQQVESSIVENVKITPREVTEYFNSIPADSLPMIDAEYEVSEIVINPKANEAERERVRLELNKLRERVLKGDKFSTLAMLYSEDEGTARKGGELGFFSRGEMVGEFEAAAFALKPGEVSPVIETKYGFHIIQLIDKRGDKIKVRHILRRPEVDPKDIEACLARLDSISTDIKAGEFTFEIGAQEISDDKDTRYNHGIMVNTKEQTGERTTRFEMGELPGEIARIVATMEIGEISKPFSMIDRRGKEVCAIIKLKNRIPAHRASITEDFQILKGAIEIQKKEEFIQNWIKEKQKSTYVRIKQGWGDCEFTYPGWVF